MSVITASVVREDDADPRVEDQHRAEYLEIQRARETTKPAVRADGGNPDDYELPQLHIGDHVTDRDEIDATMLVTELPAESAAEYEFKDDTTVADANPDYPADDDVVLVVIPNRTDVTVDPLTKYSYPRSRLQLETPIHDRDETGGEE